MSEEIKGKLEFISLHKPIMVGDVDIRERLWELFSNLNKLPAQMNQTRDSIHIGLDENSDFHIRYENDKDGILILLEKTQGFGMSNIGAYLPDTLQSLNGRVVYFTISDSELKVFPDKAESVFGLYYTRNNCCKIPDDKIHSICKPGTSDCCIFMAAGGSGFECLKFDTSSARMLLDRFGNGKMNASRIGNCEILGRKEE